MTFLAGRSGRGRRALVLTGVMLLVLGVMSSSAAAQVRAGTFSCQATGGTIFQTPLGLANPQDDPCANDNESVLAPTILDTTVGALHGQTAIQAGALPANGDHDFATASAAGVLTTLIPGYVIKAAAVSSTAQSGCAGPHNGPLQFRIFPPSSSVVNLTINGTSYPVLNQPLTIPLGVGTVYVNRTIVASNGIDQIGLEVDLGGSPVLTLAQSSVDFSGNPCGTI